MPNVTVTEVKRGSGLWRLYQRWPAIVSAYLVEEGASGLTLIDTGAPRSNGEMLAAVRRVEGRTGRRLARVALTHAHFDHIGALARIIGATGVPALAHVNEAEFLIGTRSLGDLRGHRLYSRMHGPRCQPIADHQLQVLADGEQVGALTAVHTPGHTPGHLSFFHTPSLTWITGDVVANQLLHLHGPPWPFTYDLNLVRRSARRFLEQEFTGLCFGHGEPVLTDARQRLERYLSRYS